MMGGQHIPGECLGGTAGHTDTDALAAKVTHGVC